MRILLKTIKPVGNKHTGTLIFLHGSGDTGHNLNEWVKFLLGRDMTFPHIKVIYPTAPEQPYTPNGGAPSNVWFDRRSISIVAPENRRSLAQIYDDVHKLIEQEVNEGIPLNRIIVGGFSMGGALAMHIGYHLYPSLAGVFAISSFLNRESIVYESLRNRKDNESTLPELQMFHGERDTLVPIKWGKETFNSLDSLGVTGHFQPVKNTLHELKLSELNALEQWILKKIPESEETPRNKL